MKIGYGFAYFKDERDAKNAIRRLNNTLFGEKRKRRLNVKWGKGAPRHKEAALKPNKKLFVVNLDPFRTKVHHIETHFEPHGKVLNVRIIRNFAFVEFATQEDATKALNATQRSKILDRPVIIKYSFPESNEGCDDYAGSSRRRSPSLEYRRSPEYDRYKGLAPAYERRMSPDYGRRPRTRSPGAGYGRYKNRSRSPVPRERPYRR